MDRRAAIAQVAAAARRLPAPRAPEAARAGLAAVTLRWKPPKGAEPAKYVVLRGGHAMAFSEFGRRVAENASADTDHGAGGLMLAMGSAVKDGLASEWPGCASLARGNLKVPTDFRSVYRGVIEEWLGDDPQAVLGGAANDPLVRGDGLDGKALFR